jgi:hypothetical protein
MRGFAGVNTYYNNNMEYQTEPPKGRRKNKKEKLKRLSKSPVKGDKLSQ